MYIDPVSHITIIRSNLYFYIRMASEASKRAEEDRMRRIQLQEEQDLAYAIALSKAEAVSLKQH